MTTHFACPIHRYYVEAGRIFFLIFFGVDSAARAGLALATYW